MHNYHTLTKLVDHMQLIAELKNGGVTTGISINHEWISLNGEIWDNMDDSARREELTRVATIEGAHAPTTITEVPVALEPHAKKLQEQCETATGGKKVSIYRPNSYPGTIVLRHQTLAEDTRAALVEVVKNHDASVVPILSVDTAEKVIASDGVTTGEVIISDSRGASAEGNTIKVIISAYGTAGITADSFVLDGEGQAAISFGAVSLPTGALTFVVLDPTGEADPVSFRVRRGTP